MKTETELNAEVFSESEIPFEVAERIVKARIAAIEDEIKRDGGDPYLALSTGYPKPNWRIYRDGVLKPFGAGDTLAEALANIPDPQTIKAKRIAELEAELSTLKS